MTKAIKSGNVYLVEHYTPGLPVDGLACLAARVRETAVAMATKGRFVRYLRSTIVPVDEALLCVFEADSEELVREVYARAGVPFERLSAAIADESESLDARSPPGADRDLGNRRNALGVWRSADGNVNVTEQDKSSAAITGF